MKDFDEFVAILDSDECKAELKRIADDELEKDRDGMFGFMLERQAIYRLKKYHEWANS